MLAVLEGCGEVEELGVAVVRLTGGIDSAEDVCAEREEEEADESWAVLCVCGAVDASLREDEPEASDAPRPEASMMAKVGDTALH